MSSAPPLAALIRQISPGAESIPDDLVLERYVKSRDQAAFELLVWRHGTLVWNVCRRMLAPDRHAAEDACQAAFLALASHATRLRHKGAIAAWLHRVAVRAALDILASHRVSESHSSDIPEVLDHRKGPEEIVSSREIGCLLDAGVNHLPDLLRIPFVMCELEGKCNAETARALGCPIGTVESRLTRARKQLRGWLAARGVAPVVIGAAGAVPETVRAAMIRPGMPGEVIPTAIQTLAWRAVGSTFSAKFGATLALVMMLSVSVAAFWIPAHGLPRNPDNPPGQPSEKTKPMAASRLDAEGVPLPPGALARLGSTRLRHARGIGDLACSPDKSRIASNSWDQTIRVWDAVTGRQICLAQTQWSDGRHLLVSFTADGKTVVAAGSVEGKSPEVLQIDAATGAVLAHLTFSQCYDYGYDLAKDGTRFAACDKNSATIRVFDTNTARELWQAKLKNEYVSTLAFADDSRTLAATADHLIQIFDSDGKPTSSFVLREHPNASLESVRFSPDGNRVAACWRAREWGSSLGVWDRKTGQRVWSNDYGDRFSCHPESFSPDGKWIVRIGGYSEGRCPVVLTDAADGKDRFEYTVGSYPSCPRFRSDGLLMLSNDGAIRLIDPKNGKPLAPSPEPPGEVYLRGFSTDGKTLFGAANSWIAWETATGRQRQLPGELDSRGTIISPDGRFVARLDGEKDQARLEIYDAIRGKLIHSHRGPEFDGAYLYKFTPQGNGVIGRANYVTRIWAVDTGKELRRIEKSNSYYHPDLSADGRVLVTAGNTGEPGNEDAEQRINVWDLQNGREIATFTPVEKMISYVAISANGRRVAASVYPDKHKFPNPHLTVWDVASGKVLTRVPQGLPGAYLALSPDGRMVAVAGREPELRVYEVASGSQRFAFRHEGKISDFIFSPNGKLLAASSPEAPVYLWDLTGESSNRLGVWITTDANSIWTDLGSTDAAKAFQAMRKLRSNPVPAIAFLNERIKPVTPDADTIKKLFAELGAEEFAVREKSEQTLAGYGDSIRLALERELSQSPSPEVRQRLQTLLAQVNRLISPDRCRTIRVVEAVEGMGTADADQLLAKWAKGAAGSTLADEATAAQDRRRN